MINSEVVKCGIIGSMGLELGSTAALVVSLSFSVFMVIYFNL